MEASEAFAADRTTFEQELDGLIAEAANAANLTVATPVQSRDRDEVNAAVKKRTAALIDNKSKRQKLGASPVSGEVAPPSSMFKAEAPATQPNTSATKITTLNTSVTAAAIQMPERPPNLTPEDSRRGLVDSFEHRVDLERPHVWQEPPSQQSPSFKTEGSSEDIEAHGLYVHSSRRVSLDRPDASKLREVFLRTQGGGSNSTRRDSDTLSSSPTDRRSRLATSTGASSAATLLTPDTQRLQWTTSVNPRTAVKRQWNNNKDDLDYKALLELRRNEKLDNVDRYVPTGGMPRPEKPKRSVRQRSTYLPFAKLPEAVQTRILCFLLVSGQPIKIDFTWLRSFIQGHARVPAAYDTVEHGGVKYEVPTTWNRVVDEVATMQDDMAPFASALDDRRDHARRTRAPCRGLTTSLFRVSRNVHKQAARVFYSQNIFHFPWASTAWMQLESFLATIGETNVAHLRSVRIHVPLWHGGIYRDFIEGALLDLTPPVSRFAIIKPPAHDRLLGAIEHSAATLLHAGPLTTLELELENGRLADIWTGRSSDTCHLIAASDAEEHTLRKQKALEILKRASVLLPMQPTLRVFHGAKFSEPDYAGYERRYASLVAEAEKYGWAVESSLRARR